MAHNDKEMKISDKKGDRGEKKVKKEKVAKAVKVPSERQQRAKTLMLAGVAMLVVAGLTLGAILLIQKMIEEKQGDNKVAENQITILDDGQTGTGTEVSEGAQEEKPEEVKEEEKPVDGGATGVVAVQPGPTPAPAPEPEPVVLTMEEAINGVALKPLATGNGEVDAQVEMILGNLVSEGMSNVEKLRAVYGYVIGGMTAGAMNTSEYAAFLSENGYASEDGYNVYAAKWALEGTGTSDSYAALFMVLSRRIGVESYVVTVNTREGAWAKTVYIKGSNGEYYNFDTWREDQAGTNGYRYFGQTEKQAQSYCSVVNLGAGVAGFKGFARK